MGLWALAYIESRRAGSELAGGVANDCPAPRRDPVAGSRRNFILESLELYPRTGL